ncbi:MAG: hypothetical protein AAGA96_03820, partial [Verrucomicrobiota bacterium]
GMTVGFAEKEEGTKGAGAKGDAAKRISMMLEKVDTDGSGTISLSEFTASPMAEKIQERGHDPEKLFAMRDKDGDGEWSKKELAAPMGSGKGRPGSGSGKGKGKGKSEEGDADS